MASKRTFYKYEIAIRVLTEGPIPSDMSLEEIIREATNGGYSMSLVKKVRTQIDAHQVANRLAGQGTEPEFFNLDSEGNDLDDEDDG